MLRSRTYALLLFVYSGLSSPGNSIPRISIKLRYASISVLPLCASLIKNLCISSFVIASHIATTPFYRDIIGFLLSVSQSNVYE